ncbi:hypothetical protein PLEOSDRAFT_166844 [Pleurotus ostreatus PC15]|uniref:Uncharacterized protein n=1 Tax=Pleurotus ostreatus (strain PC15) TaxID=1137138 RepID=A0A067NYH5_PLEO1|nr:hypothetical protein PLEOSDRAFT_166844 [Pleurotus ostreatus PC15]
MKSVQNSVVFDLKTLVRGFAHPEILPEGFWRDHVKESGAQIYQTEDLLIEIIWREVPDLNYLLQLLSPLSVVDEVDSREGSVKFYTFGGEVEENEWDRWDIYAEHIRKLVAQHEHALDYDIFEVLLPPSDMFRQNKLPNLQCLEWYTRSNSYRIFCGSKLTHLTLRLDPLCSSECACEAISLIPLVNPHLESLTLRLAEQWTDADTGLRHCSDNRNLSRNILEMLTDLKVLMQVSIPARFFTPKVIRHLTKLGELTASKSLPIPDGD